MAIKICPNCNEKFETISYGSGQHKYCGMKCRRMYNHKKLRNNRVGYVMNEYQGAQVRESMKRMIRHFIYKNLDLYKAPVKVRKAKFDEAFKKLYNRVSHRLNLLDEVNK